MPSIVFLHLDENFISDYGGSLILDGLHKSTVTSFYYTRNNIGPKFVSRFKSLVTEGLKLTELNFRGCKTQSIHLSELVSSVLGLGGLTNLSLAEIALSDGIMRRITDFIPDAQLAHLDMSWNSVSTSASIQFFRALRFNKTLRYLNYSWNTLCINRCYLARQIARVFRNSETLMHVDLSNCHLSSAEAKVLCKAAGISSCLASLHLSGNLISKGMTKAISSILGCKEKREFYSNSACHIQIPLRDAVPV